MSSLLEAKGLSDTIAETLRELSGTMENGISVIITEMIYSPKIFIDSLIWNNFQHENVF